LFKIYVGAILFILIAGVIIITIRRQILKGKLYKLELDLLRAQINPHFIFNTLTSIQHTILLKSKEIAIEQLSKFARLMRMGLDFSRLDFVPVDKVLQFFQTYVAVESVNLDEEIDFAITVDPQIDQQKMTISPMIIQPFIENAIIHGLAPKQKNMQLKLDINKTGSYLTCQITDNGIGRKAAAEIAQKKAKTHQSMGIKLSTQKIRAQMAKNRIQSEVVSIEDNYDATGHASGTTIRIIIPFKTLEHS
jgi:sensor histidine kinase YesM